MPHTTTQRFNQLRAAARPAALCTLAAFVGLMPAASALAFGLANPMRIIPGAEQISSSREISVHPYQDEYVPQLRLGLGLRNDGPLSLDAAVRQLLRDQSLHPALRIGAKNRPTPFALATGLESRVYGFWARGLPLCRFEIRAQVLPGDEVSIVGAMPEIDSLDVVSADGWPNEEGALASVLAYIDLATGRKHDPNVEARVQVNRCYHVVDHGLRPAYEFMVLHRGMPWTAIADDANVWNAYRQYFDATATVRVYDRNPLSTPLKDFEVDVDGSGLLANDSFRMTVPTGIQRAESTTGRFNFAPNDPRFIEASAFAHINRQLAYFESIGYSWIGPKPLVVVANTIPDGEENNAFYRPAAATGSFPRIELGNGDGKTLRNLGLDSDVVSHELGHHIVYRSITSIENESLVLHEGLSDFFTFASTNDGCLGESICPAGSTACARVGKCLRTAENSLKYKDSTYRDLGPHNRGMLVSGFLWDLRADKIPVTELAQLVNKSLDFMKASSSIRDFLIALLTADRALTSGKHGTEIIAAANARGMESLTKDINLNTELPEITGRQPVESSLQTGQQTQPPQSNRRKQKEEDSIPFCGTLGGNTQDEGSLALLLLLLIPVAMVGIFGNYGNSGRKGPISFWERIPVRVRINRR